MRQENSKSFFIDGRLEEKRSAQDTLYTCLDGALRMISPFMPFLTEELWQRLPRRPNETTETIIRASYPVYDRSYDDEVSASQYDLLLSVVKTARSMMSQYNIVADAKGRVSQCKYHSMSDKLVYVQSSDEAVAKLVEEQKANVITLIKGCDNVEVVQTGIDGCAITTISKDCSVLLLVKGFTDLSKELGKSTKKVL